MPWEAAVNYRTPLARARGLGSAKEGVSHWWVQRLTAVALLPLLIWLVTALALLDGYGYPTLIGWVAQPVHAILLLATILALFWHSSLGLQVVIEDYIGAEGLRMTLIIAVKFAHILGGIISIFAVLKIALGSA
jgi:succinate dehydrogenase / fumarate reductase membrane anchor subunit